MVADPDFCFHGGAPDRSVKTSDDRVFVKPELVAIEGQAKRRLRETARAVLPHFASPGHDYVLIGRAGKTADRLFADLLDDLRKALNP